MNYYKIRTNKTTSTRSVENESSLDVNLEQTSKLASFEGIDDTIDVYERFVKERSESNKFRLIFTVNPYCTNVLFNPITEIVKNEGSNDVKIVRGDTAANLKNEKYIVGNSSPLRWEMIMNTEYSKPEVGYVYLPGIDIFTNHNFRNRTFKMVNYMSKQTGLKGDTYFIDEDDSKGSKKTQTYIYNTIADHMRHDDTSVVPYMRRMKLPSQNTYAESNWRNKHLYDIIDIDSYEDSIANNLTEDYGWAGFTNNSTISPKVYSKDTGVDTNSSRILNDREGCEFVDMYPDRTLFSFNPKYNDYRKRMEYNWDVCITYPYMNYYKHGLVQDCTEKSGENGMKIMDMSVVRGLSGELIMLFRTYVKHGLKKGESFRLVSKDTKYENSNAIFKVTNIGNLKNENKDYYFYTRDIKLIEEVCPTYEKMKLEDINANVKEALKIDNLRYRRYAKGCESEYYFRMFRKLPNLKKSLLSLTDEIANDNDKLYGEGGYVEKNAMDKAGKNTLLFEKEMYRLAFARTIYNDISTQITYTDTIDVDHFVDNRKRPLTSLYLTIVKRNKGANEWYFEEKGCNSEDVEYSHCFGKVTSGVEMSTEEADTMPMLQDRSALGDVRTLNNVGVYNTKMLEDEIDINGMTIDGSEYKDCFLGDIVEYNAREVEEHQLCWVNHRFNTMQREMKNTNYQDFHYQEIAYDDYDTSDFTIKDYHPNVGMGEGADRNTNYVWNNGNKKLWLWTRPEGYYYRPHYEIPIKAFGDIQQSSHYKMSLSGNPTVTNNRMLVTTTLQHHAIVGDSITFRVEDDDNTYYGKVYDVFNNYIFSMVLDPVRYKDKTMDDFKEAIVVDLRRTNPSIPAYAEPLKGTSTFMWRDVLNSGDLHASDFPEYTFANGAFYIHTGINFFLKRQDPDGWSGLQCIEAFPNDIGGNMMPESIYDYKDETYIIC